MIDAVVFGFCLGAGLCLGVLSVLYAGDWVVSMLVKRDRKVRP